MLHTLGLYIVNVQWSRASDGFLTIFIFEIRQTEQKLSKKIVSLDSLGVHGPSMVVISYQNVDYKKYLILFYFFHLKLTSMNVVHQETPQNTNRYNHMYLQHPSWCNATECPTKRDFHNNFKILWYLFYLYPFEIQIKMCKFPQHFRFSW